MSTNSGLGANGALAISRKLLRTYLEEAAATSTRRRKIVGQRIREAREEKTMLQKELAARVHVEPQTVSNWERGVSTPDLDKIELLSQVLGRPVRFFFADADPASPPNGVAADDADILAAVQQALAEIRSLREGQAEIATRIGRLEDAQAPPAQEQ